MNIAIVGAGICGSMLAYECIKRNLNVTVYEQDTQKESCSYTAAGMLAPMAELESANTNVYKLGLRSLTLWPSIIEELAQLNHSVFYRDSGTLVLAHTQDAGSFTQFHSTLKRKLDDFDACVSSVIPSSIEPELKHFHNALHLKQEAQVDSHQALTALHSVIRAQGEFNHSHVHTIACNEVNGEYFDWVFDCRGLAAKDQVNLYGVRGERILLHAPEVNLQHMIRLMHPKYKLYIVPRENHHFIIGATEIESADDGPISVRSALELLSAAYSVHKGFAEARIISMSTGVRPTSLDHQPIVDVQVGLTRINGLYRHGYLLTPAIIEQAFSADLFKKKLQQWSMAK
ncbi:FAD-dependent oxidoreductase [Pseudomonas sp. HK3]